MHRQIQASLFHAFPLRGRCPSAHTGADEVEVLPTTPHQSLRDSSRLAVPEKCCGLTLILAFFDRCGNCGFPSSATGSGKPQFPLKGKPNTVAKPPHLRRFWAFSGEFGRIEKRVLASFFKSSVLYYEKRNIGKETVS